MRRKPMMVRVLGGVGAATLAGLAHFGRFWAFSAYAASFIPLELASPRGWRRLLPQCFVIGTRSVPVIMLTGMFIGMVLIVQGWAQFDAANMADRLGAIVVISVCSELGPVLAGVMLAGRAGGALTAELGTMNVTEQIDALRVMGADPMRVLVVPRFIACLLLTPVLTIFSDALGVAGGWLVSVKAFDIPAQHYWLYSARGVDTWNIFEGLIKAFFFGGAIGLIGCYKGFTCGAGASGVGRATTESFVASFIAIIVLNFFFASLLRDWYVTIWGFRSTLTG